MKDEERLHIEMSNRERAGYVNMLDFLEVAVSKHVALDQKVYYSVWSISSKKFIASCEDWLLSYQLISREVPQWLSGVVQFLIEKTLGWGKNCAEMKSFIQ